MGSEQCDGMYSQTKSFLNSYNCQVVLHSLFSFTVTVLGFESQVRTIWKFEIMKKQHYIPIFLLCEFSNILSIIILLKTLPNDMGDIDTYLQVMTTVGVAIVCIIMYIYVDGYFIYHKLRNVCHAER